MQNIKVRRLPFGLDPIDERALSRGLATFWMSASMRRAKRPCEAVIDVFPPAALLPCRIEHDARRIEAIYSTIP